MREVFCQQCQLSYPSWWQNCGIAGCARQARPKQAPPPTLEQLEIERQRLERKITAENRERAIEAVMRECQEGREKSGIQVMFADVQRRQRAALDERFAADQAEHAAASEPRRMKARGTRLEQRLDALKKARREHE